MYISKAYLICQSERIQSIMAGTLWLQGHKTAHCVCSQNAERDECWCFPFLVSVGPQVMGC